MKVAFVTDDEKTICPHFGRAKYYEVFEIDGEKIKSSQIRDKSVGHSEGSTCNHDKDTGKPHGCGAGADIKHRNMADAISDCDVLIARGMGWGAYEALGSYGIKPLVTDIKEIDEAVRAFVEGKLENKTDRLH